MLVERIGLGGFKVLPAVACQVGLLLAGCSTVIHTERIANSAGSNWSYLEPDVPIKVHGQIPGISSASLAAMYIGGKNREIASLSTNGLVVSDVRVDFYFNPTNLPGVASLCDRRIPITDGEQAGATTDVVAVLCSGDLVVARATGTASLTGLSANELKIRLDRFRSGLFTVINRDEQSTGNG